MCISSSFPGDADAAVPGPQTASCVHGSKEAPWFSDFRIHAGLQAGLLDGEVSEKSLQERRDGSL